MKHFILFISVLFTLNLSAQDYKFSNNTYYKESLQKIDDKATGYFYSVKDVKYPIYISSRGSCYIIRISQKTNKEYKQYLGKEISQDICNKLNITYQSSK